MNISPAGPVLKAGQKMPPTLVAAYLTYYKDKEFI